MWDRNLVCVTKSILTLETRQWWMVGYWCDSVVSKTHNVTKIFLKLCFKCYHLLQFYEEFCTHSIPIPVPHDRMKFYMYFLVGLFKWPSLQSWICHKLRLLLQKKSSRTSRWSVLKQHAWAADINETFN